MPRPTSMTNWWKLVLDTRAQGSIALLASLCGVTTRTLHRWQCTSIRVPDALHRRKIREVAGAELLKHPLCPKYLKVKKTTNA